MNASFQREIIAYGYFGGFSRGDGHLVKKAESLSLVLPILGVRATY